MENTSKYIATVSNKNINEITNNAEILINNLKILIKRKDEEEIHITKNNIINIDYNEPTMKITYNSSGNKIVFIKFDEQSNSAYKMMTQELRDFNKVKGVIYYPSGNIKMKGEFILDDKSKRYSANGNANVYYDVSSEQLYYEGEIENEAFDGSGIFYNNNGNISLKVNNIDQNNPIGFGLLIISDFSKNKFYEKTFSFDRIQEEIDFNDFNLDDFVKKNNKVDCIFDDLLNYSEFNSKFILDKKISIELKSESITSNDEKYELLYRKIYILEIKIDEIIKTIQDINVKVTPKKVGFFS